MRRQIVVTLHALRAAMARWRHGPGVVALVHGTGHGLFALDVQDSAMARHLRSGRPWGERELAAVEPYLTAGSRVLVVGAHVGTLAVPLARSARAVVAIEPNPDTYRLLAANLALNGVANCRTVNVAAGDRNEEIEFLVSRANSGGSKRLPRAWRRLYYYDHPRTVRVKAVRLDDLLPDESFDVVVMDAEGSEYFALKGMERILAGARALEVEFEPHHLRDVAGVTVDEFVGVIEPHFTRLLIPSRSLTVGREEFAAALRDMYRANQRDDGLVFAKE